MCVMAECEVLMDAPKLGALFVLWGFVIFAPCVMTAAPPPTGWITHAVWAPGAETRI